MDDPFLTLVEEDGREERIERERVSAPDGPLRGVLVGIKDVFHVDGLPTRAGSALPPEVLTGPEGTAVKRLRAAGAVVLGKTVTAEFAYAEPGPTRNPRDPSRTPGGSSSGSAAAVAAGLCEIAIGTQTIGSVIRPASYCGVFGFKPSFGAIPTDGMIGCAPSFDTVGIFARDLHTIRRAFHVLTATAPRATTLEGWPYLVPDTYLERVEPQARDAFDAVLEKLPWRVTRVRTMDGLDSLERTHRALMFHEMAQVHHAWYERFGDLYRPRTAEAIEEGRRVGRSILPHLRGSPAALRSRLRGIAGNGVWLTPAATGPAPAGLDGTGDPIMNLPWTHTGWPVVTIPTGEIDGMPVGLQVCSPDRSDEKLLEIADGIARMLTRDAAR